jgi:hypothetical protein
MGVPETSTISELIVLESKQSWPTNSFDLIRATKEADAVRDSGQKKANASIQSKQNRATIREHLFQTVREQLKDEFKSENACRTSLRSIREKLGRWLRD